jgi:DNA-binding Lrp family transcriptional regulator
MDDVDRAIINIIQSEFPITARPYLEIAERVHVAEQDVLDRIKILKKKGIIRRIGGNFDSRRLNFTSTLCAAKVPKGVIEAFVEAVNQYPGVTHNYLRDHEYNVWFTFIAPSKGYIRNALEEISRTTGVTEIRNLPAVKMFKIRVDFEV